MKIDTNNMYKLINMLIAQKVPFELSEDWGVPHIQYPSIKNCICSVVCNHLSRGHCQGLLEIKGLLYAREMEEDTVKGYLTPYDVFERISTRYLQNKKEIEKLICE